MTKVGTGSSCSSQHLHYCTLLITRVPPTHRKLCFVCSRQHHHNQRLFNQDSLFDGQQSFDKLFFFSTDIYPPLLSQPSKLREGHPEQIFWGKRLTMPLPLCLNVNK